MRLAPLLFLAAALVATGCRPGPSSRPLNDTDPIFVVPAVTDLADEDLTVAQTTRLAELLDDPDSAVRLAASQTLERRSGGENFGYRYWADDDDREASVRRWKDWLISRRMLPSTRPGEGLPRP